ncbi:hypothetical protein, partial [Amphritea pacifica]|uniref:hypothetical protein n=1 Tax=Amphritea pacifica TaxID=2811233 RepID=UPI0019645949
MGNCDREQYCRRRALAAIIQPSDIAFGTVVIPPENKSVPFIVAAIIQPSDIAFGTVVIPPENKSVPFIVVQDTALYQQESINKTAIWDV